MAGREHILEDIQLVQAALCDCTELDTQQATLAEEMEIVGQLIRQCIEENTIKVQMMGRIQARLPYVIINN